MRRTRIETASFIVAIVLVTLAFVWLVLPYYGAILWAVVLVILFEPLHERLLSRSGGRRNLAAALSLVACLCLVVVPGVIVLRALVFEAAGIYERMTASELDLSVVLIRLRDAMPAFMIDALSWLGLTDLAQVQARLSSFLGQIVQGLASRMMLIGQGTMQLAIALGVMLYLLFFLFRDGVALAGVIRKASPFSGGQTEQVFRKFASVVRATVKGNVIIALLQGGIGGLTFWALGIEAALLWGVVMAVLSLLPAVGAAIVWFPVALYLLVTGDYLKGAALLVVGTLVISLIDNLLRPQLVGKDLRLPDYLILISTLGGITLIGINGFVVGPMIAALFVAFWSQFAEDRTDA